MQHLFFVMLLYCKYIIYFTNDLMYYLTLMVLSTHGAGGHASVSFVSVSVWCSCMRAICATCHVLCEIGEKMPLLC